MKVNSYTGNNHTFVICAYGESPYLKSCIRSLQNQTEKSRIIMATSTPNSYVRKIAKEFNIPLYVNQQEPGIATDWNFAFDCCHTELVTIAHQDDLYNPEYLERILKAVNRAKNPILIHTAYYEIRNKKPVYQNKLLLVKRLLLLPFTLPITWNSIGIRRCSLAFGCAICCPSVTYVKARFPKTVFETGCKADLDWQAWEKYSKLSGAFCYVKEPMVGHRVHEESETSRVIGEGRGRNAEDFAMYQKFWPKWIAKLLLRFYQKGQNSNQL